MLGNSMSNQDEDEVEDELEAMEREANGAVPSMPNAPSGVIEGKLGDAPKETAEQKAKRRRQERAARGQTSELLTA